MDNTFIGATCQTNAFTPVQVPSGGPLLDMVKSLGWQALGSLLSEDVPTVDHVPLRAAGCPCLVLPSPHCSLSADLIWGFHGFATYHLIMHLLLDSSDRRPSTSPFLPILPS